MCKTRTCILFSFLLIFFYISAQTIDPYMPDFSAPPTIAGMQLIWNDEFNTEGKPNPQNWKYENGFVRNEELQWYQSANVNCTGGLLVFDGKREQVTNPNYVAGSTDWKKNRQYAEYTSGSILSQGLKSFKFGRFEIRARIDTTLGSWPAIWTKGITGKWPYCGEIDIMEYYRSGSQNTPVILANTAYGSATNPYGTWNTKKIVLSYFTGKDTDWCKKFHVWRMDWDEEYIKLYLDDELLNTTAIATAINPAGNLPTEPFKQEHFILLNLAIGANGGNPTNSPFPIKYEVDYVRVYQPVNTSVENVVKNTLKIFPNPVSNTLNFQTDEKPLFLTVYDLSGKKIMEKPMTDNSVDVSALQPGYYLAKVKFENNKLITSTFTKIK